MRNDLPSIEIGFLHNLADVLSQAFQANVSVQKMTNPKPMEPFSGKPYLAYAFTMEKPKRFLPFLNDKQQVGIVELDEVFSPEDEGQQHWRILLRLPKKGIVSTSHHSFPPGFWPDQEILEQLKSDLAPVLASP